jgi:DNA-binding response OmpR family regulator
MEFVKIEANALRQMREQIDDLQRTLAEIKRGERNQVAELQTKFSITRQTAQTLSALIEARGQCVSRADIANSWGPSKGKNEDRNHHAVNVSIDRHIQLLRRKLGYGTIVAVYGQGFRLAKDIG